MIKYKKVTHRGQATHTKCELNPNKDVVAQEIMIGGNYDYDVPNDLIKKHQEWGRQYEERTFVIHPGNDNYEKCEKCKVTFVGFEPVIELVGIVTHSKKDIVKQYKEIK